MDQVFAVLELAVSILECLEWKDIGNFDNALTSRNLRPSFLTTLQTLTLFEELDILQSLELMQWIHLRGIQKVNVILCVPSFLTTYDKMCENFFRVLHPWNTPICHAELENNRKAFHKKYSRHITKFQPYCDALAQAFKNIATKVNVLTVFIAGFEDNKCCFLHNILNHIPIVFLTIEFSDEKCFFDFVHLESLFQDVENKTVTSIHLKQKRTFTFRAYGDICQMKKFFPNLDKIHFQCLEVYGHDASEKFQDLVVAEIILEEVIFTFEDESNPPLFLDFVFALGVQRLVLKGNHFIYDCENPSFRLLIRIHVSAGCEVIFEENTNSQIGFEILQHTI